MEVLFLDCRTLEVLDYGNVSDEFTIIIDNVVPQVSDFKVNKVSIKAAVGDYLVIKNSPINYIGIINSIDESDDNKTTNVKTKDFISILDIKVKLTSYSGNLLSYLSNLIRNAYAVNADTVQNLPYLTISTMGTVTGSLNFDADTIGTISSVVATLNKAFSVGVSYSLAYINGRVSGITLILKNCTSGLVLKHNISCITELVITDNNTQGINKITYLPKASNTSYTTTRIYYLLTDGTVSTNSNSTKRYKTVNGTTKFYSDSEYSSLYSSARSEMLSSSLDHSIVFKYLRENKIAELFVDLNIGDFIEFIGPHKTYETMVTKITFKNNLYQPEITLGEYRLSLTEKLKLLSKK